MSNATNRSHDPISRFSPFEWAAIIVLASLANISTFLEEFLTRTFDSSVRVLLPDRPIHYLLWGLTVALAIRIARRDGTATLYMMIAGAVFAVIQPAGIVWAFGFVLAGIVIDTYMSGRRTLALVEVGLLVLVASVINRNPGLQQLLNSVNLDLAPISGIRVPFLAVMLIVILASIFGRLHFQFLSRPTAEYASNFPDTMVGVTLHPVIGVFIIPSFLGRTALTLPETPIVFFAVAASILLSSLLGGSLGFGIAERVRQRLGLH